MKMTKKAMKNSAKIVIKVGYCQLQHILNRLDKDGYAVDIYGWACDLYKLNRNFAIVTGYRPVGDFSLDENQELKADLNSLNELAYKSTNNSPIFWEQKLVETLKKHFEI